MSSVAENWLRIQEELQKVAPGQGIRIVGVTKGQPVERLREGIAAGLRYLGNNYVQPGSALRAELADFSGEWHFIGHIQSRKAKELLGYHCIESLDRLSVAEDLGRRAKEAGVTLPVFVEVNIGGEGSKSGVAPGELEAFLDAAAVLPGLRLEGLMAMPPPLEPAARRPYFQKMRGFLDQFSASHGLKWLSMGTSEDYREAVAEGANLIRLGTVLFGSRPPKAG